VGRTVPRKGRSDLSDPGLSAREIPSTSRHQLRANEAVAEPIDFEAVETGGSALDDVETCELWHDNVAAPRGMAATYRIGTLVSGVRLKRSALCDNIGGIPGDIQLYCNRFHIIDGAEIAAAPFFIVSAKEGGPCPRSTT
jgi:hypothetical protein